MQSHPLRPYERVDARRRVLNSCTCRGWREAGELGKSGCSKSWTAKSSSRQLIPLSLSAAVERELCVSGHTGEPANADRPIKTVVSRRAFHDDAPLVPASSALRLERVRFKMWHPENEDVVKFLRIATTPALQPVLVHCQHGSDRTGTMVAIYRIAFESWTKAQATDEMINGGFGFHPMGRTCFATSKNWTSTPSKHRSQSKGLGDSRLTLPSSGSHRQAGGCRSCQTLAAIFLHPTHKSIRHSIHGV